VSTAHRTVIALCAGLLTSLASSAGADLHAYWDARCRSCHGESGPFARSTLRVDAQGRLLGWHHGADLERFLRQHYLADELVHPVSAMLAAQVVTPPLFRQQCAGCHGAASDFARRSLALREDGALVGKKSGLAVHDYLRSHGGLQPAQVSEMVRTLTRVLGEVGGPTPR
jgi:mono/diheme cytochrome c family protein